MLKKIGIAVAVLLVAVLGFAATRPDVFHVERAVDIKAAPEAVHGLIDDFHKWPLWSPYDKRDPAMAKTYSGAAAGTGAVYAWAGNHDVGQGRMEIIDSVPGSKVSIKLDFMEPFEGHNVAQFTLSPHEGVTHTTWAMDGPSPYISKLMGLVFDMDALIGKDFEAGLANLKAAAEK